MNQIPYWLALLVIAVFFVLRLTSNALDPVTLLLFGAVVALFVDRLAAKGQVYSLSEGLKQLQQKTSLWWVALIGLAAVLGSTLWAYASGASESETLLSVVVLLSLSFWILRERT